MKTTTTRTNRNLKPGTTVVSKLDGEPGKVVGICTRRRCGDAWSYDVKTASGKEIWYASELFVPAND